MLGSVRRTNVRAQACGNYWTQFAELIVNNMDITSFSSAILPRDAMRCAVLVIVILSVRLSVTLVDCVHMVRPTIMVSSPHASPIILVSADIRFIPKFEGDHPERGR